MNAAEMTAAITDTLRNQLRSTRGGRAILAAVAVGALTLEEVEHFISNSARNVAAYTADDD